MKLKSVLLGSAMLACMPALASAGSTESWYLGLGLGANWLEDVSGTLVSTVFGATESFNVEYDTGWVIGGALGYKWDDVRLEFDLGYRANDIGSVTAGALQPGLGGDATIFSQMLNLVFDIPLGERAALSLGGGLGGALVNVDIGGITTGGDTLRVDDDDYVFAYQAIAGLSIDIGERTQLFGEYRYFRADKVDVRGEIVGFVDFTADDLDFENHSALFGLRYYFGEDVAEPAPPPPPPPPTSFNVYFQKKTVLTAEGHATVAEAADVLKSGAPAVTIEASGLGSGTDLGQRRGAAVARALADLGIAPNKISVTPHPDGSATVTATSLIF